MSPGIAVVTACAVCLGGLVAGYAGFGFNLLTVPVLTAFLGPVDAIVLTLLAGGVVSTAMSCRLRELVAWRTTSVLLAASVPGLAVGVWLVANVDGDQLRRAIGLTVAASAVVLWVARTRTRAEGLRRPRRGGLPAELSAGVLSGVLVSGAAMSGPPVVWLYGWRRDPEPEARASSAGYIAAVSLIAVPPIVLAAGMDRSTGWLACLALPPALVGLWLGTRLFDVFSGVYPTVVVAVLGMSGLSGLALSLS